MKDLRSSFGVLLALTPAVIAATSDGAEVSLQGFNSATVVISTGAIAGSGDYTVKLQESDEAGGTYTDVVAANLLGEFPASLAASSTYKIGYRGNKGNLRLAITKNGGTSIAASAVIILGHPTDAPVA